MPSPLPPSAQAEPPFPGESSPVASTCVDVWHATASGDRPSVVEACCEAWLTQEERIRADRFRRRTTRNQHVIGRGMARRMLGGDAVDALSICFRTSDHGKPTVASPPQARQPFNIAHTEGLVLLGITSTAVNAAPADGAGRVAGRDGSVLLGVDVERIERRTDPKLADRYFAAPEVEFLHSFADPEARKAVFLRIWTLKECFIKAIGTGLHTPLGDFAFEDIASANPKLKILNPKLRQSASWTFHCFEPRPGFVGALAVGRVTETPQALVQADVRHRCFDHFLRDAGVTTAPA